MCRDLVSKMKSTTRRIKENIPFALFIIIVLIFIYGTTRSKASVNIDDARYFLSAIIQSLATILAITITITLVGVQMSSKTYTHKIQNYFLKSIDLWGIMFIFVFSIFFCSFILINLSNYPEIPSATMTAISNSIKISMILFLLCFLSLGIFIKDVLSFFSLENIINKILGEVDKNSFLKHDKKTDEEIGKEMMPVFDIIINALNRNDYETASLGINKLKLFFINVLLKDIMDKDTENSVNLYLSREIKRISKICIRRDEEDVFDLIISSLGEMGTKAAEANFIDTAKYMMGSLVFIGEEALSKKWCSRVNNVSTHLQIIGRTIINSLPENLPDMDQEEAFSVFKSIEYFGSRCLSLDFIDEATYALNMIGTLEKHITLEKFNDRTRQNIKGVYPRLRDKISGHK